MATLETKVTVAERFLGMPTDLGVSTTHDIAASLAKLRIDIFVLYVKTRNFYWRMSGLNVRDYHVLLDEQGAEIFATAVAIAEHARKIAGTTVYSISDIAGHQPNLDNNADCVDPRGMLAELERDNKRLVAEMRRVHELCDEYGDVATASLLEVWIDETARRSWFLLESCRSSTLR